MISDLEIIGHLHAFGCPIGGNHTKFCKRAFQSHGFTERLCHRDIFHKEIGISTLVVQLSIKPIFYRNVGKIGRVIMQIGRFSLFYKIGPRYKFIGIVRRKTKFEGNRSIGIDYLSLGCNEQCRTIFGINSHLITKIVLTPIYVCQSSLCTIRTGHRTCHLQGFGCFEHDTHCVAVRVRPGFVQFIGTACHQSQQSHSR